MADIQPFVQSGLIDPSAGGMNTLGAGGGPGGWADFLQSNPNFASSLMGGLGGLAGGALGMFLGKQQGLPFGDQMQGAAGALGNEAMSLYGFGQQAMNELVSGKLTPG